jgi:hypothetical protein
MPGAWDERVGWGDGLTFGKEPDDSVDIIEFILQGLLAFAKSM